MQNLNYQVNGKPLHEYSKEFVFWESLDFANKELGNNGESVLTTRQIKQLHSEYLKRAGTSEVDQNGFFTSSYQLKLGKILSDILSENGVKELSSKVHKGQKISVDKAITSLVINRTTRYFPNLIGLNTNHFEDACLPLSPYDEDFSMNQCALTAGSRLMYAKIKDLNNNINDVNVYLKNETKIYTEGKPYEKWSVIDTYDSVYDYSQSKLFTPQDKLKLGYIAPYISQSELTSLSSSLEANEKTKVSEEAVRKAANILNYLKRNGYTYSLAVESGHPENLIAKIDNTPWEVRVLQTDGNEKFIGRCRNNSTGQNLYISDTSGINKADTPYYRNQELTALCYALGNPIIGPDNKPVDVNSLKTVNGKASSFFNGGSKVDGSAETYNISKGNTIFLSITSKNGKTGFDYQTEYGTQQHANWILHTGIPNTNGSRTDRDRTPVVSTNPEICAMHLEEQTNLARKNFSALLRTDDFIAWAKDPLNTVQPRFSSDEQVALIQKDWVNYLTNKKDQLENPEYHAEILSTNPINQIIGNKESEKKYFDKTDSIDIKTQQIRQYANSYIEANIGHFNIQRNPNGQPMHNKDGKLIMNVKINPVQVTTYALDDQSIYHRKDNFSAEMGIVGLTKDNILGRDDFNVEIMGDHSARFNPENAIPLNDKKSDWMQTIRKDLIDTVHSTGGYIMDNNDIKNIAIDENGIIQYTAWKIIKQNFSGKDSPYKNEKNPIQSALNDAQSDDRLKNAKAEKYITKVTAQIGPVFDYDKSDFALQENIKVVKVTPKTSSPFSVATSYDGDVIANKPGEHLKSQERLRVYGFDTIFRNRFRSVIRDNLLDLQGFNANNVGNGSQMLGIYKKAPGDLLPYNWYETAKQKGQTDEQISAIIRTKNKKVRLSNDIKETDNVDAAGAEQMKYEQDPANDNFHSTFRNMDNLTAAVISEDWDGFDMCMTSGGSNIGINRYMKEGTKVDKKTHTVIPSHDPNDKIAIKELSEYKNDNYNPGDRRQKAGNDTMNAEKIAEKVGYAQVPIGGWTMDDAYVVSKDYAHQNQILLDDGTMRDMIIGDKMDDFSGNKGTISLVVDRNWTKEEAKKRHCVEAWQFFKDNEKINVIGASFSAVGRMNGGTFKDMNDSGTFATKVRTTNNPDGKTIEGTGGYENFQISNQTAERKTTIYHGNGQGRKASSQLSWILGAQDLPETMKELYSDNFSSWIKFRDMLNICGMDITEKGEIFKGYHVQNGEDKYVFEMLSKKDINEIMKSCPNKSAKYHEALQTQLDACLKGSKMPTSGHTNARQALIDDFKMNSNSKGGWIEVPFELKLKSGVTIPKGKIDENGKTETWLVPFMSPNVRSASERWDGQTNYSEYTNYYVNLFKAVLDYQDAKSLQNTISKTKDGTEYAYRYDGTIYRMPKSGVTIREGVRTKSMKVYAEVLEKESAKNAQIAVDCIANRLLNASNGPLNVKYKRNFLKEGLMSARQPQSATAVVTPNPSLAIDEIAMSKKMAKELGFKVDKNNNIITDGIRNGVLAWRDPTLRPGAARYFKVTINNELTGLQVNPFVDKSMDLDFDGDQLGIVRLNSKEANDELYHKMRPQANLLDYGGGFKFDENTFKPLDENKKTSYLRYRKNYNGHKIGEIYKDKAGNPIELPIYDLFFNNGLDVMLGQYTREQKREEYKHEHKGASEEEINEKVGKSLKKEYETIKAQANSYTALFEQDDKESQHQWNQKTRDEIFNALGNKLNNYIQECFKESVGANVIRFDSIEKNIASVAAYVASGAKGNMKKLKKYANSLGVNIKDSEWASKNSKSEDSEWASTLTDTDIFKCLTTMMETPDETFKGKSWANILEVNLENTGYSTEEIQSHEYANATKTEMVGKAGKVSQRGYGLLRKQAASEVLNLTYLTTQSVLQVKHQAEEAKTKVKVLQGIVQDLWNGNMIYKNEETGQWETAKQIYPKYKKEMDEQGNMALTPETDENGDQVYGSKKVKIESADEWFKVAYEFFKDPDGMNTPPNPIMLKKVAKAMEIYDNNGELHFEGVRSKDAKRAAMDDLAYNGISITDFTEGTSYENPKPLFEAQYGTDLYEPAEILHNYENKNNKAMQIPLVDGKCQKVKIETVINIKADQDKKQEIANAENVAMKM